MTLPAHGGAASKIGPTSSIYEQIGGTEALETVVEDFYTRVLADQERFHAGRCTASLRLVFPGQIGIS
jgi:hypothetical protein